MKDIKDWLMRARRLQARVDQLEAARRGAWDRATSITQTAGGAVVMNSGVSRKAEPFAILEETVDEELRRLAAVKAEIVGAVSQIRDNTMAALLMAYYVNGHPWEQVALEIHYSYFRTVHDKHPQALAALAEVLEERRDRK